MPLINLHRALADPGMVTDGLAADGLHLGTYGGDSQPDIMRGSAMLTIPALRYGANRRNLIWLQALDRLDRAARMLHSDPAFEVVGEASELIAVDGEPDAWRGR